MGLNLTNLSQNSLVRISHFFSEENVVTGGNIETENRSTNFNFNHTLPQTSFVKKHNQNRLDLFFQKHILQDKVSGNNREFLIVK